MQPGMYIFLNKSLGMSTGKAAAQAGHAAVEAYRLSCGLDPHRPQETQVAKESHAARNWYKGGHYAKYVMEAQDSTQLFAIRDYLSSRGFQTALVIDEGHTEDTYFVPTALGVEIVDREHSHVKATFGEFKLYKDTPQVAVIEATDRVTPAALEAARELAAAGKFTEASKALSKGRRPRRKLSHLLSEPSVLRGER